MVNGVIGNQGRKVALDAMKIEKPEKANFSEQKVIQGDLTLCKDRLHLILSPEILCQHFKFTIDVSTGESLHQPS